MSPRAPRRELIAWAFYDFANSGYTTVVLTAIYNAYFVGVVAAGLGDGGATLAWTAAIAVANALVLITAPLIGAMADHRAAKKRFLLMATIGCVGFTALLGLAGPGEVGLAALLLIASAALFATGENPIAGFLPEIAGEEDIGRVSAYGWALGYIGGVLVLGLSLAWIFLAQGRGQSAPDYVPMILIGVALVYGLAALPTFFVLRERARPQGEAPLGLGDYLRVGWGRLATTLSASRHYRDLFRFLVTLTVYHAGIQTVVVLAAVYAQQAMGFGQQETIALILVVNLTAAVGALAFGHLQDRFGSVPTLAMTLILWIAAIGCAWLATGPSLFWFAANLVGLAMGSSQSAGRALIGLFSPPGRSAEFFGLWGFAVKLAAVLGPLSYGLVGYLTGGDHRTALLVTGGYFVAGLVLLTGVNERRGREAALRM